MAQDKFKRKLTTIFSADVASYSRPMGEDEAATVTTLEQHEKFEPKGLTDLTERGRR
jgi:hypothetical protein